MRPFYSFLLATTTVALSVGGLQASTTLFSENFDTTFPSPLSTGPAGQFDVPGTYPINSVAVYGSISNNGTLPTCVAPESGNCLNLASAYDSAQIVSHNAISLAPGTYTLSFLYGGSNRPQYDTNAADSATVSLGNLLSKSFSIIPTGTPTMFTDTFTVTSMQSAYLTFTDTTPRPADNDSYDGVILDNIDVASSVAPPPPPPPATTPEPASVLLLGSGAGVLALYRLKSARRK